MISLLKRYLPLALAAYFCYGSLSRFTSGRYTSREFYEYQIERAPNDDSAQAWVIPIMDALFATMLLRRGAARKIAALAVVSFSALGIKMRMDVGKDATSDIIRTCVLGLNALVVYL